MKEKTYTGIGSRKTPKDVLILMTRIAKYLAKYEYTLRSGGADGADSAFEDGSKLKEIYTVNDTTPRALDIAAKIHPNWRACSDYAKNLHGRNVFQVLGKDIKTPSEFLICWTPKGEDIGGTRTAIVLARENNIPVYNLENPADIVRLKKKLLRIKTTFLNNALR